MDLTKHFVIIYDKYLQILEILATFLKLILMLSLDQGPRLALRTYY